MIFCFSFLLLLLSAAVDVAVATPHNIEQEFIPQIGEDQMLSMRESDVSGLKGSHLFVIPWPGVI